MNPLLKMAVLAGAGNVVRLHLQRTGEVDELDSAGMSLLMHAANRGHAEVFKILLDSGADPFLPNRLGTTAYDIALKHGQADILNVILKETSVPAVQNDIFVLTDSSTANDDGSSSTFDVDTLSPDQLEKLPPHTSQVTCHAEEDSNANFFNGWIEETEPDVPENNPTLVVKSSELQEQISSHQPKDNDADWSDIHIELPEFIWAHAEKYLVHDCLETERKLILHGIRSGRLVSRQIEDIAELAEVEEDGYSGRLQMVLNDLGVRIDSLSYDYTHPCNLEEILKDDEPEAQLAEDAIRFLWEMNNPSHDPYWLYLRDIYTFHLLDANKEQLLGKKAEAGILEIMNAVALFPPAIAELIKIISTIKINSIFLTTEHEEESDVSGEEETFEEVTDDIEILNDLESEYSDHDREQRELNLLYRITTINSLYNEFTKVADVANDLNDECKRILKLINDELSTISFSKEVILRLADVINNEWSDIVDSVTIINNVCTKKIGMDPETFSMLFKGNESNIDWCRNLIDYHTDEWVVGIAEHSDEILEQQVRILDKEKNFRIPLHEFFKLYDRMTVGRDKLISAHTEMVNSNLRLAHHLAKKYQFSGLPLLDLIQEANLGLMKAAERFDYHRGFRFSTFATWWIRQSITRAIADKLRIIRIPVHVTESLNKMNNAIRQLQEETNHEPSPEQIAEKIQMPLTKVNRMLKMSDEPVSIESKIGDLTVEESVVDSRSPSPFDAVSSLILTERTDCVLSTLEPREEKVIRLRFGIGETSDHTLEEVGMLYDVTRERIRQIEAKALEKLRHPNRSKNLRSFAIDE